MKYSKKQFLDDVMKEAKALKKSATPEEIQKLNPRTLNPKHQNFCIYGQMTGHCNSQRAMELISTCCKRYINHKNCSTITAGGIKAIKSQVDGTKFPGKRSFVMVNSNAQRYLSSIEGYILLPNAKSENLIDYLKGEKSRTRFMKTLSTIEETKMARELNSETTVHECDAREAK